MAQHMEKESTSALCLLFRLATLATMELASQRFVGHTWMIIYSIYSYFDVV